MAHLAGAYRVVDTLRLNTQRGTKTAFLTSEKCVHMGVSPPPPRLWNQTIRPLVDRLNNMNLQLSLFQREILNISVDLKSKIVPKQSLLDIF